MTSLSGFNRDCFTVANGFECNAGSLSAGRRETLQARLRASQPGLKQVPIEVTHNDPDPGPSNNGQVYEVDVTAIPKFDLAAELTLPSEVALGDLFNTRSP